jgi:hypothetical protein
MQVGQIPWSPMRTSRPGSLPLPRDEVGVPLRVDGNSFLAGLRITNGEHNRRRRLGVGAATSTGLLHTLWALPHGVPVLRSSLPERDQMTLNHEGFGWIDDDGCTVRRTYEPPGTVGTVIVIDTSLSRAVHRVASHPSTTRRIAVWQRQSERPPRPRRDQVERARSLGIGIYIVEHGRCSEVLGAAPALTGLPAVFRWWQAELAYRNWLMHIGPTATTALSA